MVDHLNKNKPAHGGGSIIPKASGGGPAHEGQQQAVRGASGEMKTEARSPPPQGDPRSRQPARRPDTISAPGSSSSMSTAIRRHSRLTFSWGPWYRYSPPLSDKISTSMST